MWLRWSRDQRDIGSYIKHVTAISMRVGCRSLEAPREDGMSAGVQSRERRSYTMPSPLPLAGEAAREGG